MPIIPTAGRKYWTIRLTILMIYTILIVGSITMIYPFALMLGSSITSTFDFDEFAVIPHYVYSDEALVKRHLAEKYAHFWVEDLAANYGKDGDWGVWRDVLEHEDFINTIYGEIASKFEEKKELYQRITADWSDFKDAQDPEGYRLYYFVEGKKPRYMKFLQDKYKGILKQQDEAAYAEMSEQEKLAKALEIINHKYNRSYKNFFLILPTYHRLYEQTWFPYEGPDEDDWLEYKQTSPSHFKDIVVGKRMWTRYLTKQYYSVREFHNQFGIKVEHFSELPFPVSPDNEALYPVWEHFLKNKYPLRLVRLQPEAGKLWVPFLEKQYGEISKYNELLGEDRASFAEVPFPAQAPQDMERRLVWIRFVLQNVPVELWELNTAESKYHQFLQQRYPDIAALNAAYETNYQAFAEVETPWKTVDFYEFKSRKNEIRWDLITNNYRQVIAFVTSKHRALWNTLVLVLLTVGGALTVNPLAAYVLSRGNQKTATKILIFFLATMAFPAEVAMIPGFLLLKNLNLLNTFAALVLPGIANGYSIFLLKGFFDSIPRELYEAATIDGASESQMFRLVTYPMCKPILAVIALNAFTIAYGGFMWAFLVCQDSRMWTMMVWLYEFQWENRLNPGMIMAALTLASVPTLLVFLFCQKIILRGIIIPTMK
ncbi:MAG: ABC transporter permease subunit [Planctomycetes bacterium]|nr:ABC transporter permease subunit [Planctomycetota bacterium]